MVRVEDYISMKKLGLNDYIWRSDEPLIKQ